jgi:hypothetical protein
MLSRTIRTPAFVVLLFLFFLNAGCERQTATGDIQLAVTGGGDIVTPETFISAELKSNDILVEVAVVNHGSNPFPLLRWNLPSDGRLTTNLFQVQRDGQVVEYKGLMVKRKVTAADFIELEPKREYRARISLAQGYDVNSKGRYSIQYRAWNQSLQGKPVISLSSNVVTVEK